MSEDLTCGNCGGSEIERLCYPDRCDFLCHQCRTVIIVRPRGFAESINAFHKATRADRSCRADREGYCGYSQEVVDALTKERAGLLAEIDRLKKQQGIQWISVKERLPERATPHLEYSREVLVYGDDGIGTANYDYRLKDWQLHDDFCGVVDITHWAEIDLPEAK